MVPTYIRLFLIIFLLSLSGNIAYAQSKNGAKPTVKPKSDLYLRAPDVVPGTLPEMRQASYWISKMKSPDKLVLTTEEIGRLNTDYQQKLKNISQLDSSLFKRINKQIDKRPGLLTSIPDLSSMTPAELSNWTQAKIKCQTDYLRSRDFGNIMSIEYSDGELDAIENEISFDNSKDKIEIRYGTAIAESRLHVIPPVRPEYVGNFTSGKAHWDLWKLDVLPIGTPVQVLFTSRTGAFLFVLSDRGYGWLTSEKVALGTQTEIDQYVKANDFIVCTGDWVPFYTDDGCTIASGWLRMGNRIPFTNGNSRIIKIPARNTNGSLTIQEAWLKSDADVYSGYLPYTRRNVANQAFKFLDNLYDWTGAWYGRNHMTNLRDIFSVFGFNLPSNGILLSTYGKNLYTVSGDQGKEIQFNSIFSNEAFLTLQVCENSHTQMYLGNHEGMPIVFDAHGYGYKNEEGNEMELKRWVVGTMEMPDYFLKQEITFVNLH